MVTLLSGLGALLLCMTVMESFTPIASTIGGVLIGIAAAGLLMFHGRIAGISGIVLTLAALLAAWSIYAVCALVMVSCVVKVFEATMKSVVSGSTRFSTSLMCVPSTLETKCARRPGFQ